MQRDHIFRFIAEECEKLPPDRQHYAKRNGDIWLCCPWHNGGNESTPSLKVNLDPQAPVPPGQYYCFGCKTKGDWNTFAQLFELRTVRKSQMKEAASDDSYLKRRNITLDEAQVPDLKKMAPWDHTVPWRSIPGRVVNRFYGRSTSFGRKAMLYIPVMQYGEHVGGIQARLTRDYNNKKEKAYINTSGDWSHTTLFGFDQAAQQRGEPLWVVEGPRDTMWVNANGGRAVGLIGSAVTPRKIDLIRDLDPPCILVATDPDDAGEQAADRLFEAFRSELPIVQFPFKEGEDPAKLKAEKIEKAITKMRRLGGAHIAA